MKAATLRYRISAEKQCAKLPKPVCGLPQSVLIGTSLAQDQSPAAGAKVRRGGQDYGAVDGSDTNRNRRIPRQKQELE